MLYSKFLQFYYRRVIPCHASVPRNQIRQAYSVRIIWSRTHIISDQMPDEGKKLIKEIFSVLRILSGNLLVTEQSALMSEVTH